MAKTSYPTPKKTPTKRKYSGSSYSKAKKAKKRYPSKKFYKKLKKYSKRGGRTINVQEDKEFANVIKRTQKVTRSQQKIINKRFKNGYSPFQKITTSQIQLNSGSEFNKCKWIWRCACNASFISDMFNKSPLPENTAGDTLASTANLYIKSEQQSIYLNKVEMKYEIMNPTNYDMNLIIYDIVYKEDLDKYNYSVYYENDVNNGLNASYGDPIALLNQGIEGVDNNYQTADPTALTLTDVNYKPTMSYPFNIYCKIQKKQIFRLQPGATMTHIYKFRPKALINRGYYAVKYNNNSAGSLKNITCGCLFKIYGQISGTGETSVDDMTHVANASGKIMIKERLNSKWYFMTPKYNYVFKDETEEWTPDQDEETMEVVNDSNIKPIQTIDLDNTNNDPGTVNPAPSQT